jgi:hypothetical protein
MKSLLLIILFYFFSTNYSYAHQSSTAYLSINDKNGSVSGTLQIRFFDLDKKLGIDENQDGKLIWGETLSNNKTIKNYLLNNFSLFSGETDCQIIFSNKWQVNNFFNEGYLYLPIDTNCTNAENLKITYSAFFDDIKNHKLLIDSSLNQQQTNYLIKSNQQEVNIQTSNNWLTTVKDFTLEGIIHIWIGLDHILFLFCLLFACTLAKENKSYLRSVLIIVSLFTIAHSITLTAMALGWIQFSSKWIEAGIAATVLFSALNNIIQISKRIYLLTFSFGLLHGLGFASVLGELGIPSSQPWLAVAFFNIGVELGQVMIVLLILPLLIFVRKLSKHYQLWLKTGSGIIALISVYWLFQRL